jgi:hypothetical protein
MRFTTIITMRLEFSDNVQSWSIGFAMKLCSLLEKTLPTSPNAPKSDCLPLARVLTDGPLAGNTVVPGTTLGLGIMWEGLTLVPAAEMDANAVDHEDGNPMFEDENPVFEEGNASPEAESSDSSPADLEAET